MKVTPHVTQSTSGRRSTIDGRTTRHGRYAVSQRIRMRIEEAFGWIKTVAGQDKTKFRGRARRMGLHLQRHRLQPGAIAEAHGSLEMTVPAHYQLIGRWRIVEADLWDRDYLDLVVPAAIVVGADNHGEIAFGAMQAGLDLSYSPSMVSFTWAGFDEMDEITGDGSAQLLDDGSIEITFPITMATRPPSMQNESLLQQPANARRLHQQRAPRPLSLCKLGERLLCESVDLVLNNAWASVTPRSG